jgi:Ca-activated chloride channel family protein
MAEKVNFSGSNSNEFIAQLWAIRRVGWLLDEIRLRGESREVRDEVVELARRFAIVTPYTSYLIVEDEARRGVPLSFRSFQLLDGDRGTQALFKKSYTDLESAKDGYNGALAGRANNELKNAQTAGDALDRAKTDNLGGLIAGNVSRGGVASGGAVATTPAKPGEVYEKARNRQLFGEAGEVQRRYNSVEQQTKLVNGKTFSQNGAAWNDTDLQTRKDAKRNRVQFASQDYFDLLTNQPESAQWLALGNSVTFTMKDEVYEIYE